MKPDGNPAFPHYTPDGGKYLESATDGMSLRDYFAAAALTGLIATTKKLGLADKIPETVNGADYALAAFEIADAMLKEREK